MFGRQSKWLLGGLAAGGAALALTVPVLKRRGMCVTSLLKKDHRVVSALILAWEKARVVDVEARKALFRQIRNQLSIHAEAEEEILYPVIRNMNSVFAGIDIDEAFREHWQIKNLLYLIERMEPMASDTQDKMRELKEAIAHHVGEEESELFPFIERAMSRQQQQELGARIHARKLQLKGTIAA
jgi:hemerythrin-like domain-containing protein